MKYKPSKTFYIFVFSIPSLILLLSIADYCLLLAENKINSIYQKIKSLVEKNSIIFSLCLIVISSSLIYLTYKIICKKYYNLHEKNVILVDYYTVNKQWDKAYEIALQDNSYDYFENINFNRCVYNSGRFGRSFFIYPQLLGSDALFPDKIPAGQIALLSSDFYYELGYVSEALHWAYEAQSSLPYSIRVLERLTLVHLIEGRYDAAKTYIDILKDAYYTNDFVNKYSNYLKDTALISKDPEIQEKRQFMPHNFYTPSLSFQKFILLINVNPNNKRATEYLAMHYLLEHQIGNFIKIYDKLKDIYSDKIPHIYEHAITLYLLKTKNYDFKKYNIGKNSIEQVMDYYKTISQFSKKEAAYEILTKKYAGSYLYYLTYESPLVTKMTLKSRAVE